MSQCSCSQTAPSPIVHVWNVKTRGRQGAASLTFLSLLTHQGSAITDPQGSQTPLKPRSSSFRACGLNDSLRVAPRADSRVWTVLSVPWAQSGAPASPAQEGTLSPAHSHRVRAWHEGQLGQTSTPVPGWSGSACPVYPQCVGRHSTEG